MIQIFNIERNVLFGFEIEHHCHVAPDILVAKL